MSSNVDDEIKFWEDVGHLAVRIRTIEDHNVDIAVDNLMTFIRSRVTRNSVVAEQVRVAEEKLVETLLAQTVSMRYESAPTVAELWDLAVPAKVIAAQLSKQEKEGEQS